MSDPPSEADGQSLNIDQLIADFKARTDAGEKFSFEKLLAAYPEHTEDLTRYFQQGKELEAPQQPDKESSTGTSAPGKISLEDATAHTMIQGTGDSESSLTRDFRQPNTEATAEIEISKTFSRYEIQKVLGQGAMGAVYLARDTQLDRNVALKIPKFGDGNGVDEAEMLARFYREARAAATLRSPNICPVYDVGEIDGQHYITMAFIEGRPLKDYTKSKKTHSEKQIITTIRKLALGLAEAHEIGVIHRDLKPANIMVDLKGEPVVMDFGLARRSSSDDVQVTQSGAIIGTPAYMAPEQVAGDQTAIDHRVDIYALGVIMYELITGEMPFKGNLMALLQQIALNNPTKPSELRPDIDPRLEAICLKMIAGDREQRYQSMTDVANDLQEVLRNPDERHRQVQEKKKGPKPKTLPTAKEESNPALISIDRSKSSADRMRANQGTSAQKSKSSGPPKQLLIAGGIGGLLLLLGMAFFVRPGKQDEQIAAADSVAAPVKDVPITEDKVVEPGQTSTESRPVPTPAVAPFDEKQAKKYQQEWADYLGVPVEKQVTLPDGEKITFVLIPPGEFMMGSGEQEKDEYLAGAEAAKDTWSIKSIQTEFPQQHVKITKPFYLGKFEVTQAQWKSVMGSNPSQFNKNLQNPVDTVSWDDIDQFLVKSNTVTASQSFSFTLPTQAQWEFACRAGGTTAWHDTESEADLAQVAWHKGNASGQTHPVGQLHPNAFGLYDMHGNVLEWCSDFHSLEVAQTAVKLDPVGPTTGKQRIRRGGHIFAEPRHCRAAYKAWFTPDGRQNFGGFRLAMTINTKTALLPPLAVAPFDATQAQKYQQEWADYLGEPVETTNSIGMKFTIIPPGKFKMGEGDHVVDVTLTKPFRLGMYELTQGQWKAVMETEPWKGQQDVREGENFAASFLDWSDATEFCRKLTEQERTAGRLHEGWEYRLPTEAEWEYACRAGTTTRFSFGDSESLLSEYAWSEENTRNVNKAYAQPVGLKKPNPWGLYDIHGNVREWCSDRLGNRLAGGTDPTGPVAGSSRMYRGGGWDIEAKSCRTAIRIGFDPSNRRRALGCRVALSPIAAVSNTAVSAIDKKPDESKHRGKMMKNSAELSLAEMLTSPAYEWTEPVNMGPHVNSGENDVYPTLSADGLSLIFTSTRGKNAILYECRRASVDDEWGPAQELIGINLNQHDQITPWLSGDGLTLLFGNKSADGGNVNLFQTRRATRDAPWDTPIDLGSPINSDKEDGGGALSPDGLTMYLASKRPGSRFRDLYRARRPALDAPWQEPKLLGREINVAWEEKCPQLLADGKSLMYLSGEGKDYQLMLAQPVADGRYDVQPLESPVGNISFCLSANGQTLIFDSKRHGGLGGSDLWMSRRVKKTADAPPPAVAPFDEKQANAHQKAWADYLGEPVMTTNSVGMQLVVIPPGNFKFGEASEAVPVTLTKPFRIGIHEVTQGQWKEIMGTEPWKGQEKVQLGDAIPATYVSWIDVTEFCRKLSEREQATDRLASDCEYRLPTQAEWEYACRAGTTTEYSFGNDASQLEEYGWAQDWARIPGKDYPRGVGLKKSNPWGLYDVHGNVWEWCSDWHIGLPGGTDPQGPGDGTKRIVRGGSWTNDAETLTSANRFSREPSSGSYGLGFRVVRTINTAQDEQVEKSSSQTIDLLADLVPTTWNSENMSWQKQDGILTGNSSASRKKKEWVGATFPQEIEGDYVFELELKNSGFAPLQVDLPLGDKQAIRLHLGGLGCALMVIDGKEDRDAAPQHSNKDARLKRNVWQRLTAKVRHQDENVSVDVALDGERVGLFSGLRSRITLPKWIKPDPVHIKFAGTGDSSILELEFRRALVLSSSQAVNRNDDVTRPGHSATAPPPTVAPFDATQAKKYQQEWADYLGVSVEKEVQLPGGEKMKFMLIPPGEFKMGSSEEEVKRLLADDQGVILNSRIPHETPQHRVIINKPFLMSRYEVTRGDFRAFVEATKYKTQAEVDGKGGSHGLDGPIKTSAEILWNTEYGLQQTDAHPVVQVDWSDAVAFCDWLSIVSGVQCRLPTEEEWEYACRAGTQTRWSTGDDPEQLKRAAWIRPNSKKKTHPVGELLPNSWGLYDMHGNVLEWCADDYREDAYIQKSQGKSQEPDGSNRNKNIRGGSFFVTDLSARSAYRGAVLPNARQWFFGFRVVMDVETAKRVSK